MPLSDDDLRGVQGRVYAMLMDTIRTFEEIEENADVLYGEREAEIRAAIDEYLNDFIRNTRESGEAHPETLIYKAGRAEFQRAGLYGAQLDLKERQVGEANAQVRLSLKERARRLFRRPFGKWVDRINNFLSSLTAATGMSEAIKELKDCLRDELPDEDERK